jgi:hypothetical protein
MNAPVGEDICRVCHICTTPDEEGTGDDHFRLALADRSARAKHRAAPSPQNRTMKRVAVSVGDRVGERILPPGSESSGRNRLRPIACFNSDV